MSMCVQVGVIGCEDGSGNARVHRDVGLVLKMVDESIEDY